MTQPKEFLTATLSPLDVIDRYTIICKPFKCRGSYVYPYLGTSENGLGVSMWGEFTAQDCRDYIRNTEDRLMAWGDLPESTRKHFSSRLEASQ